MGMSTHKFGADRASDCFEIEAVLLAGDLGMKHHLQQQIPQFLLEICVIAITDRIGHFVGLLQHIRHQRGMGLPQVPGTALCWIPQLCHDVDELLKGIRRAGGHRSSA